MNKKLLSGFLCVLLIAIMLTGCTQPNAQHDTISDPNKTYTISFQDDDGTQINLEAPATRIISLYSAHTENLYALGAGNLVIGGHSTCVYPPEAASTATYDYTGDPEYVIAAEPDLVLIRPFISRKVPDFVSELKKAGITVVSLYPESYEEFPDYIKKLAMLVGKEETAEQMLSDFYANIDEIAKLTANVEEKQTVFFESTEVNIRTVSADSLPARAIAFAGGINLAEGAKPMTEGSSIAEFGTEQVLAHADEIDVYISQRGSMNSGGNLISISERPGYETIKAVQDNRVYLINEKLLSSPTFRYYKGVHEIARFLYPALMDSVSAYQNDALATKTDFSNMVVRTLHIPVFVPSSSKYYQTDQKGHTYGLFEDVKWTEADFDNIETAVYSGYIGWELGSDGKEYFHPEANVTRDELAKAIFVMGDFSASETHGVINDLDSCSNKRIVQTLVDNDVFKLTNGNFNPNKFVTNQEILNALRFVA
jgi:iron complex transport system substrate-binding protein